MWGLMTNKQDADRILREFLENATPAEREELNRLLDERKRNPMSIKEMNIGGIARSMAEDLQKTMGLTQDNIRRTAVDMVVRLARQHQPDISDAELQALVNEMVPNYRAEAKRKLPPEIVKTMVLQFVSYSMGEMPEHELRELPDGWAKKYWSHFPVPVQQLISDFLKGGSSRREFWKEVTRHLG